MRRLLAAVAGLFVLHLCASSFPLDTSKRISLRHVTQRPVIDGVIDPVWSSADSVSDFFQLSPFYARSPRYRTVASILTTDDALFCLIVCYQPRSEVQANAGLQDNLTGDIVSIMLDTFNDNRTAYKFAVGASGVRSDCRLLDDARNRDYSWDGVWFAKSRVYDWGYVVEMEIPYRSIQYDQALADWGIDFDRWITTEKEDLYWNTYQENEGLRVSRFGRLQFGAFRPGVKGLNLEVYPVGITKATYLHDGNYKFGPDAGVDLFYNPSQAITFQLTANPDFAQIEADPFSFNITRYETYFDERRPFFTQGNEIFMPSGREQGSGFYQPLELFYSRRVGRLLPGGGQVLLLMGTKAFGRVNDWEYGGFVAMTDETHYKDGDGSATEPRALFASARVKRQILDNSSIGVLMVGKRDALSINGVVDVDGAFRASDWQLSYQIARSFLNESGDVAGSFGLMMPKEKVFLGVRGRYVGDQFDVSGVGFVPWVGTWELTALSGPRWYFDTGSLRQLLLFVGGQLYHKNFEYSTDRSAILGINMQFRSNWGYEIDLIGGRTRDEGVKYGSYEIDLSSWYNISPQWNANVNVAYGRSYNFGDDRDYVGRFAFIYTRLAWQATPNLELGTSANSFIEWKPDQSLQDITYNARPYCSVTPLNDLNVRVYLDNVFVRSADRMERILGGLLFSYSFLPKSWIYFAWNEVHDRSGVTDAAGLPLPPSMHLVDRVAVFKIKYLYAF